MWPAAKASYMTQTGYIIMCECLHSLLWIYSKKAGVQVGVVIQHLLQKRPQLRERLHVCIYCELLDMIYSDFAVFPPLWDKTRLILSNDYSEQSIYGTGRNVYMHGECNPIGSSTILHTEKDVDPSLGPQVNSAGASCISASCFGGTNPWEAWRLMTDIWTVARGHTGLTEQASHCSSWPRGC